MADRIDQLITLGREHYNAGELDRAEPLLTEAAAARPSFPDIYNMLGVIHHAQGRFQEAEEAFETALRINPRYTEAALNLAVTYNDRGKYDRAREVYARVVSATTDQANPLDQFARGKLANMHADLAAAYASLALFNDAVREYSKALDLCPQFADLRVFSKALDLCPQFADLRVRLGNVYRDMGVPHAAIAEFEHAKRLRPDYLPARIHLGITMFSVGRRDAAIAEWQAVLASDPANKSAQLYLRMVNDEHGPKPGSALQR